MKDNNKERHNMDTNKQVSIQIKIDQQTWIELKRQAKRKGMFFSKYIQKLLIDSLQKEQKNG